MLDTKRKYKKERMRVASDLIVQILRGVENSIESQSHIGKNVRKLTLDAVQGTVYSQHPITSKVL